MAPTQWFLFRDGEKIEATKERWNWEAIYADGTILKQFDDEGIFHPFKDIDQSRLICFLMRHVDPNINPVYIAFNKDLKLIHFYQNRIMRFGSADEARIRLYCFGYEEKGVTVLTVILPNDAIVITNDANNVVIQ
jgi:hypothetical protein